MITMNLHIQQRNDVTYKCDNFPDNYKRFKFDDTLIAFVYTLNDSVYGINVNERHIVLELHSFRSFEMSNKVLLANEKKETTIKWRKPQSNEGNRSMFALKDRQIFAANFAMLTESKQSEKRLVVIALTVSRIHSSVWLTHWSLDMVATILHETFSNVFSGKIQLSLKFHWANVSIRSYQILMPSKRQAMIKTNDTSLLTHIYVTWPQ